MTTNTPTKTGYAPVNGLEMYYEIHGSGQPLVLLHGAFSAIGTSFGGMLPALARNRQVIGVDMQAHGRTADIDRALTIENLADDIAALLKHLGLKQADFFGYSMGAAVALNLVMRYPELVRKLVMASISYRTDGLHPGLMDGLADLKPEWMYGSPWHNEYMEIAPRPEDFPMLVTKVTKLNMSYTDLPAENIQAIKAPTLIIIGDSDIVRPEHAVEMFRLFGGGVSGDTPAGLPNSQLAILPGTSHSMMPQRAEWISSMLSNFLDAPIKEG